MKPALVLFVLLIQKPNLASSWVNWLIPIHDPDRCNRPKTINTLYICNPDGELQESSVAKFETLIEKIRNETQSPCSQDGVTHGYTIWMSIMSKYNETLLPMSREFHEKHSERMQHFVQFLHSSTKSDPESCDDGVTFLISVEDKKIASVVGKNARPAIKEEKQNAIDRESELHLGQQNVKDAVHFLLDEYGQVLRGGRGSVIPESDKTALVAAIVSVVLIVTLLILAIIVFRWLRGLKPHECVDAGANTTTDGQSQMEQSTEEEAKPTTDCPPSYEQIEQLEGKQPFETEV